MGGPVIGREVAHAGKRAELQVACRRFTLCAQHQRSPEAAPVAVQAGPPYELDPYTLETKAGRPSSLDGWVPVGKAPSTTGSFVLDKARARACLRIFWLLKCAEAHVEGRLKCSVASCSVCAVAHPLQVLLLHCLWRLQVNFSNGASYASTFALQITPEESD